MALLWADPEPDAAPYSIRRTLWHIRQRIGAEGLASTAGQVSLTANVSIDRDVLDAAVAGQDHERAVALHTRNFLPGFAAPGGAEFDRSPATTL